MNENDIKTVLAEIFREVLEVENFRTDISMEKESSWDSLKHLQLLTGIEKKFDIEIDFKDSLKMTSVQGMIDIIKKYAP